VLEKVMLAVEIILWEDVAELMELVAQEDFIASTKLVSLTPMKVFATLLLIVILLENSLASTKLANILWELVRIVQLMLNAIAEIALMELAKDQLTIKCAIL